MTQEPVPDETQDRLFEAIHAHDAARVRAALKAGARAGEVRLDRGDRLAPLLVAFELRDQDPRHAVIRALLTAGADPNIDAFVEDCIEEDRLSLAKLLLKHGADPDGAASFGERREEGEPFDTLLIYAVSEGKTKFVKALLEAGADPNLHDDKDQSPLLVARLNKNKRCVRLLEPVVSEAERAWVEERVGPAYQAKVELDRRILESIEAGDVQQTVDLFKQSGRRLDTWLIDAEYPLEVAFSEYFHNRTPPDQRKPGEADPAGDRYLEQIETLFEMGAPAHLGVYFPPVTEAPYLLDDRLDLLERMIASVPDPNVTTRMDQRTALFSAVLMYSVERCKILLKHGVDPNIRTWQGESLLQKARSLEKFRGPNPCIPVLLEAGAKE